MYCAAPGSVQPSAGAVQTVTAISELVGDAGGGVAAGVGGVVAAAEIAGADLLAATVAGGCAVEGVELAGPGATTSASAAPIAAAAAAAAPITSSQRWLDERRPGAVPGEGIVPGEGSGGAVVPGCGG
jgi:hypothetical protein